ncbi:MAG: DUF2513 domain-containing protein [Alphaproteobacteria bacterium]|nr:MAG: DUF2513 domain-containing protein [Alphaproteobacteria bacterium]
MAGGSSARAPRGLGRGVPEALGVEGAMKLDVSLCREIMVACEAADDGTDSDIKIEIDGHDARVVSYHVRRLGQAGYLEIDALPDDEDLDFTWYVPMSVTYGGHQFLAATRDNVIWKKVLKSAGPKLGGLTLETLFALTMAEGRRRIGLPG